MSAEGLAGLMAASRGLMEDFGETPFMPLWLLEGRRPPWIDERIWSKLMDRADRQAMVEELRQEFANFRANRTTGSFRSPSYSNEYEEEMFMLYLFGVPASLFDEVQDEKHRESTRVAQVRPYLPGYLLFDLPDLEDGRTYRYINPMTGVLDSRFRAYQYQDLPEYYQRLAEANKLAALGLIDLGDLSPSEWSDAHYNLCGLDAAGHALGVEDMFQIYAAYGNLDEAMLIDGDTSWTYELRNLYREMGWEAEQIGRLAGSEYDRWVHWDETNIIAYPTFEQVEQKLREGYVITSLVGMHPGTGNLSASDASVDHGHFVNIVETMETKDGTPLVRVFNSLQHREEIFTWEEFDRIWQRAGGNSGGQAAVARPVPLGE